MGKFLSLLGHVPHRKAGLVAVVATTGVILARRLPALGHPRSPVSTEQKRRDPRHRLPRAAPVMHAARAVAVLPRLLPEAGSPTSYKHGVNTLVITRSTPSNHQAVDQARRYRRDSNGRLTVRLVSRTDPGDPWSLGAAELPQTWRSIFVLTADGIPRAVDQGLPLRSRHRIALFGSALMASCSAHSLHVGQAVAVFSGLTSRSPIRGHLHHGDITGTANAVWSDVKRPLRVHCAVRCG